MSEIFSWAIAATEPTPRFSGSRNRERVEARLEVHVAHAADPSAGAAAGHWGLLLRLLGHHRLGGDQKAGD